MLAEDGRDYRVKPLDLSAMSDSRPLRGAGAHHAMRYEPPAPAHPPFA